MSLATAFAKGSGRRVKWQGRTVHAFLRIGVVDGDRLRITRVRSSRVRAQALKLAVDRGDMRANGIVVPAMAIWSHTAPEQVDIEIVGRRIRSVDIWNAWSFSGVDSAWLGNAGMLVESSGPHHVVRCSDGLGEATFDDLVLRLDHQHRE